MVSKVGYQNLAREQNLATILKSVWDAGHPISQSYLVNLTGLNRTTVGSLVAQLQSWGLVKENGWSEPRPGRPAALIDINRDIGRLIGVEIGVDLLSAVLTDMRANIVWRQKVETGNNGTTGTQAQLLERTESLVRAAISEAATCNCRLFGIGLGVPGPVDHATGTLVFAPNLGWRNVPLRDMWTKEFGVPVIVDNEAKAAALGEQMLGVAKQVGNFVYLSTSIGLGAGVFIDGKLYRGENGLAGAVGHMTIEPEGPPCNCGSRGCWETLVGARAIVKQVRQAATEGRTPNLLAQSGINGNASAIRMEHILQAAAQGEPAVLEVFQRVGRYLGIGIANLIHAFNPKLIVLGGVLSLAGPYVLPAAQAEVNVRAFAMARQNVQISLPAFKFDACVIGAANLVLREILHHPAAIMGRSRQT